MLKDIVFKDIIASGPVIVDEDKVLLDISGNDDFWKFCGGRIKEGESFAETAKRRAKEELGMDVEIVDQKPFVMFGKDKPTAEGVKKVLLVHFLAEAQGEIILGEKVREARWISIKELADLEQAGKLGENIIPALKHFGFI